MKVSCTMEKRKTKLQKALHAEKYGKRIVIGHLREQFTQEVDYNNGY